MKLSQDFKDIDIWLQRSPENADALLSALHQRRFEAEVEGIPMPFIAVEDLITNKSAVGRSRDIADVEQLQRYRNS